MIGSGAGGLKAALQGAKAGKKVVVVEKYRAPGGSCVHLGTLPSKSLRESIYRWSLGSQGVLGQEVKYPDQARGQVGVPDMERLLFRKERVVNNEAKIISDQLERNDVKVIYGHAQFVNQNEVEVTCESEKIHLFGEYIFIAVGSAPRCPLNVKVDGVRVLDSNSILGLKEVPKRIVVLGAGVIGCEYASMFLMAGSKVHLVDRHNRILSSVDQEIVDHITERFVHHGMELILNASTKSIQLGKKNSDAPVTVELSGEKEDREVHADCVLVSMGRFGNITDLNLEAVGVQADERGQIPVDKAFRTTTPNIYAVGDVIGYPALASTSMEQGRIACCNAFGITGTTATQMPEHYPFGIYTIPEISMVGPSEEELKKEGVDYVAGKARYRELARGQIVGDRWGLLKLLIDRKSLKVLAVHIVGDNASELVHIGQAVMNFGGTANYFIENVFNYPTLAEAYKTAAFHAVNLIQGTTSTR